MPIVGDDISIYDESNGTFGFYEVVLRDFLIKNGVFYKVVIWIKER